MLLNLPPELLHKTLAYADPLDVSAFSRTSKTAKFFCDNDTLWKELFLSLFDPPRSSVTYPFRSTLQTRIRARTWLAPDAIAKLSDSASDHEATLRALVDIAKSRLPHTSPLPSRSQLFLSTYFQHDTPHLTLDIIRPSSIHNKASRSLYSHLHVFSTPQLRCNALGSPRARTKAREVVYERLNFLRNSNWGPFQSDGSGLVDWTKMEALATVMGANLREALAEDWAEDERDGIELPEGWDSTRSGDQEQSGETASSQHDWAGVEATAWVGTYAFLDFRVWEHYNLHRRKGYHPSLHGEGESVGDCMSLKLTLLPPGELSTPPAAMDDLSDSDDSDYAASLEGSAASTDEDDFPSTSLSEPSPSFVFPSSSPLPSTASTSPPLSFSGTTSPLQFNGTFSHAGLNSSATSARSIRGTVSKTPEGEVHWTYVIRYGGTDQWTMNGVQVGGAGSRFGVLGTWTAADHEDGSPHGPFWYWPQGEAD